MSTYVEQCVEQLCDAIQDDLCGNCESLGEYADEAATQKYGEDREEAENLLTELLDRIRESELFSGHSIFNPAPAPLPPLSRFGIEIYKREEEERKYQVYFGDYVISFTPRGIYAGCQSYTYHEWRHLTNRYLRGEITDSLYHFEPHPLIPLAQGILNLYAILYPEAVDIESIEAERETQNARERAKAEARGPEEAEAVARETQRLNESQLKPCCEE